MKLSVKNMVCNRCILVVEKQLNDIDLFPISVELGEVDFGHHNLTPSQINEVKHVLGEVGFELLDDKTSQKVEKVKRLLLRYVENHLADTNKQNISDYLKQEFNYDYNYISNLFSSLTSITIEHYVIQLKIEKVKELLIYDEKTLSQIAYQLGYSSVAHVSGQFKKVTGFTPSAFKNMRSAKRRLSIDKIGIA